MGAPREHCADEPPRPRGRLEWRIGTGGRDVSDFEHTLRTVVG